MNKVRIVVQSWKHYWGELKHKRNEEGLTLIELMVVVVILGIISAVAIPSISSAINSAKVSTTESDLATLQQALQRYYISNNQYPSNLTQLTSAGTGTGGPYVDITFPENDAWGHPVFYSPVTQNSQLEGYYLVSAGTSSTFPTSGTTSFTIATSSLFAAGGQATGVVDETPVLASTVTGYPTTALTGKTN